jgi:putative acetyltransferase
MSLAAQDKPPPQIVEERAPEDLDALLELWIASWRATYADIDFDARRGWFVDRLATLEANGASTLCLRIGAPPLIKGFVVIDPRTGWLDQICVHPDQFGAGAAEALIDAARRISPAKIRLDVNADNLRAIRFYNREGFVQVGEGALSQSGRPTVVLEWPAPFPQPPK